MTYRTAAQLDQRARDIAEFVKTMQSTYPSTTQLTAKNIAHTTGCPIKEWYQEKHVTRALDRATRLGLLRFVPTGTSGYYEPEPS